METTQERINRLTSELKKIASTTMWEISKNLNEESYSNEGEAAEDMIVQGQLAQAYQHIVKAGRILNKTIHY